MFCLDYAVSNTTGKDDISGASRANRGPGNSSESAMAELDTNSGSSGVNMRTVTVLTAETSQNPEEAGESILKDKTQKL